MATAKPTPALVLQIAGAPSIAIKRGEKTTVPVKAGQRYRVVKAGEEEGKDAAKDLAKEVAASQQGQDLLLTYADGTQVVLQNFYEDCKTDVCAVYMPGGNGTGDSGGYVITADSPLASIPVSQGSNYLLPLGLAAAALGASGGGSKGGATTPTPPVPAPTPEPIPTPNPTPTPPPSTDKPLIINGSVVAGPVIAGNGLKVVAYKANGTALAGGSGDLNADGTFTLTLTEAYTGPVLLRVYDTHAGPDYFDEATGAAKDLGTDLRAATHLPSTGTYTVNINMLTELAVRKLGLSGGDGGAAAIHLGSTSTAQIDTANQQVANAVGLKQDLVMGVPPVAVITTVGAANSSANDYGRLLAALSGAEVGSSTDAVLNTLVQGLGSSGLSATAVEVLVAGAQRTISLDSTLIHVVSDLTVKKIVGITIDPVASDNYVNAAEKSAGTTITGTATANALVTISWGGSTQTAIADAQGRWASTFAASQIPGDGASSISATQGTGTSEQSALRGVFIVTALPATPSVQLATDSGVSSSDGITQNGVVRVSQLASNASWQYSTDGGSTWQSGSGSSFVLGSGSYGAGMVAVRQTDAVGNISAASAIGSAITVDQTAPGALGLANNASTFNVSGLENGASWQYSTDSGSTWQTGSGTSFTLAVGSHPAGSVQVRQTDKAGNTSAANASTAAITIAAPPSGPTPDTTPPTVSITSNPSDLGANATATLTFTFSEAVNSFTASSVNVVGGTLSNFAGSGTSYTATFTPDAGLSGAATITVDAGAITDAVGNSSSSASNTVSLLVDTLAPTVTTLSALSTTLLVDQTTTLSIALSEDANDFNIADLQSVGGTLSNFSGSGRSYSATFTPDNNRTESGSVSVRRGSFSDAALNPNENGSADGVVFSIQTLRPTATLKARQTQLGMGDATTINITLSEKSTDFDLVDLTASHGTLSAFTPLGDGLRYSVVFTPEASFTGSGSVTLADGRFTNAAGNSNRGAEQAASSGELAIDTTPPTVTITSDVTALAIGQSAKVTFTFNKDPGDSFDAKDITVNGGTLTNLVNHTGTIWSARFTPTDGSTGQASITVASGRYTDTAGNQGTAGITPAITVDTQGPVADSLLPGNATTVLPGQALVLNFNEVVNKGTGNLVLVNDTASTRTTLAVTDAAVVLSNDGKTLTITPSTTLVAGNEYHVEAAPGTLLDAAGNAWAGVASSDWANSGWHFTAATPSVSLNKITADNRINGSENTAGVTISGLIESNTAGMVAAFVAGDFTVTLTPQGGGANITATASNYNSTTGAWSLSLASGALVNGKTYDISVAVTGTSGLALNATARTTGQVVADLSAAAPTLTLLNDTGSNTSDGKTNDATIHVGGLEAKASWEYSTDSGTTWHAGSGNQFTGATTNGAHTVQVRQTDAAGNVSNAGTLTFTLDTSTDQPVINAVATNNVINASEVGSVITGTAEAGASVTLSLGSGKGQGTSKFISLGQSRNVMVTADSHGDWSYTLTDADMAALGNGHTQITAVQTDVAGNTSFVALKNLTVDTFAPTVNIESTQTQLNAAAPTSTLTFTLSENSANFTASSVTVTGGTLSNFAGSGITYTATFTPTNAATTAGSVKVAAGAFHDASGNANAEASNTIELSVDNVMPTVAVTSSASTLLAGDTATLTFTLSEASDSFGADSLSVVGGTLGQLSANAARTIYTGVFTPTPGFAGAGSVTVSNSAFFDRGGNPNADGADTNNSVGLTIEGTIVMLDISSDKMALKTGETATISFTFTAAPTGFTADDITVAGGTLGALTTVDSTHYTATFTPTASAANGTASITVAKGSYTSGGNLGEGASVEGITLDSLAPTLKTLNPDDNGYLAAGNALVATFTEVVSAGTGSIRLVDDTNATTVTYDITDSAIVIDGDTLTLTPNTALVAGHNYHLLIDSTALVDVEGNAYAGIANATSWNFAASDLSTTLNPVTGDNRINDDEKTAGPIVLSGKVSSLNPAVLTALTANDIVVKVTVPRNGGWNDPTDKILTCTGVTYDSATGEWTATLPSSWVYDGALSDSTTTTLINGDTDTIRVTITGRNGTAASGLSTTLTDTMTVDLSNPAQPTLTLAGDTGTSNSDGITRNGLINVGALEAGGTWQYSVDNGNNWQQGTGASFVIPKDGATTVQVKQADAAGNQSATRSLAVTLDTQADAPGVNAIATDNRINASETSGAITGTADANASVSLVIGANTRTVTANSSGVWAYTLVAGDITAMGEGNEVIQVTQTDKAGNTSAATKAVIEVDTVLPTVTLANTGSASLLAGQSTTFTATLSELSARFSADNLTVSGGTVTQFKADATGLVYTGTFTPDSNSSAAGSILVAAGAVSDEAGNTNSTASNTLALTINTVRPTVAITSNVAANTTLHAGDTATVTFTLSEASTDFTAADVNTIGGTLGNWAAVSGTVYTATFTPDANSRAPGSVSVASGTFANAATNSNADGADGNNTVNFAIATARPTLTISSDQGTLGGAQTAQITFTFSEDPGSSFSWDGSTGDITLNGGTLSALKGGGTVYNAFFTPTPGFSGAATISVADGAYTNADGSLGQAGGSPSLTIDAVTPTVAISRSGTGTLGAGQTDTITFDFSEAPGSSFALEDIDVSGGTLGALSAVSATRYVATFTPDANTSGTANLRLANGRFSDGAGNVNADGTDANNLLAIAYATGNSNSGSVTSGSIPTLSLLADTGASSSDGITNNGLIEVSALMAGATWEYSLDGGVNWLAGSGSSFTLPSAGVYTAAVGSSQLQVRQTAAGVTSSVGKLVTDVDFRPSYDSNVTIALSVDTGISATDAISYRGAPVVSGLAATDTWRYSLDNGFSWATGVLTTYTDRGQTYSYNYISTRQGAGQEKSYVALMEATDLAGNTRTLTYWFRQDNFTAAPNIQLTPDPKDGGAVVQATNIEPGATVIYTLRKGTRVATRYGSILSRSTLVYESQSYTPPTTVGDYTLSVSQWDVAGNSPGTTDLNFSILPPLAPGIHLSDVALGSGGFVINGNSTSTDSGASVSAAGDVNGDGMADLIVGASDANGGSGRSYVVFGKATGTAINLTALANGQGGFVINGFGIKNYSSKSVSAAGDVNGDGLGDLIVGVPNANETGGASYVVFGKTTGTAIELSAVSGGSDGFVINNQLYSRQLSGSSVSAAGDVNGDGFADLIVGAPYANQNKGVSYVLFGKTASAAVNLSDMGSGLAGYEIEVDTQGATSGTSVSAAGDVNGDGLADLIMGAPGAVRSYVVFGKTTMHGVSISGTAVGLDDGFAIIGDSASKDSGRSVSAAGDVNGDGLADLIVGAPDANGGGGRTFVVFGKTTSNAIDLSAVAAGVGGFVINGDSTSQSSGYSVSTAGDINGDGLADLILGALGANKQGGCSYVVFGKSTGVAIDLSVLATGVGGFAINGNDTSYEESGKSVSAAGDVNGDGLADLLIGAPSANARGGRSYVVFGNTSGVFAQTAVDWMGTDGADTRSDNGTASTLVAGAGNDNLTATAASVLYGGAGNDTFTIDQTMITALQSPLGEGGNVGQLARMDGGSGLDTLALSGSGVTLDLSKIANQAGGNPEGGSRIDSVEVIDLTGTGNNTLVLTAADVQDMAGMNQFNSGKGWTGLAASVARHQLRVEGNAGDLLNLGTEWARAGTATYGGVTYTVYNAGASAQLLVNAAVLPKPAPIDLLDIALGRGGFVINGGLSSQSSGISVSAAGDVNGDGLTDLIIGAPGANLKYGRSYVVFGKTSGTAIDLISVANGSGGFVINGDSLSVSSGSSVSAAGDVNGDGLADLIVGAPLSNNPVGGSYVVFGKTTGSAINLAQIRSGSGGFAITGGVSRNTYESDSLNPVDGLIIELAPFRLSGFSVSAAGDVNGDGLADLIIGAPQSSNTTGWSFVLFGKNSGSLINMWDVIDGFGGGFVIKGASAWKLSGLSVSSAGDVNGDGLADLLVGAPKDDGRSYVVFGKKSIAAIELSAVENGSGGFVVNGDSSSTSSGFSVSAAGDVNGDGLADLVLSAPKVNRAEGRTYVVFGKTSGVPLALSAMAAGVGGFVINGDSTSYGSGLSVSSAGDVNGDGLADLIIGAPFSNDFSGRSYVVFGKTSGVAMDLSAVASGVGGFAIDGDIPYGGFSNSVSAAGDVNGDGLADLIVGADGANNGGGRSYVIFGNTNGAFVQTAVDWMGTDAADTRSDNGTASTLVAGAGNDSLTATAASVLYGGAGKDSFTISQAMITALQSPMGQGGNVDQLVRIDGGGGIDKIVLSGSGLTFDLTLVANQAASNPDGGSRIDSVEIFDITGTGNNTLKLTSKDVLELGTAKLFSSGLLQELFVMGNKGDTVDLADDTGLAGWTKARSNITFEKLSYQVWNHSSFATLYVSTGVTVL